MEIRYRMQSVRTGWGVEASGDSAGKRQLEQLRKSDKEKFKWSRIYLVQQGRPDVTKVGVPFRLTHRQYC